MESTEATIIIGHTSNGWYLVNLKTQELIQGPYNTHKEAKRATETRSFRVSQGWAP